MNDTFAAVAPLAMAVIGGLGIFMLGMKNLSEGMQAAAGSSLRRMISVVTDNRLMATGTGTAVTVLVQSSSITTVIVVGLVSAGLMQLHQAMGVIIGANIGTTITGWMLVLQIGKYGLPILGVAALVHLFSRGERVRYIAMAVMGGGMVFFGLELMKDGFAPMREIPAFVEAFTWFRADTYLGVLKCVAIGCILTVMVQSSSATLGITIGLATTGAIPFATAAALVLGENIGTTITVVLASIGANTAAKRAAYAHVLFNVIGVLWITSIFPFYLRLVSRAIEAMHGVDPVLMTPTDFADPLVFGAVMTAGIALTHTGFNVANTLLFLPILTPFARLLERLVPEPGVKEVARLRHLDARAMSSPTLAVEQSRGEVVQMGRGAVKMVEWVRQLIFDGPPDEALIAKTFHREEVLDNVQREIVVFLTEALDGTVPHAVAEEGRQQFRIAHEYESVSDRLASILRAFLKLRDQRLELPEEQKKDLLELHDAVADFLRRVTDAYAERSVLDDALVESTNTTITRMIRRLRKEHLELMTETSVDPSLSLIYTGVLTDYRRIRAHTLNLHEAAAGQRTLAAVD